MSPSCAPDPSSIAPASMPTGSPPRIEGLPPQFTPKLHFAKGSYFALSRPIAIHPLGLSGAPACGGHSAST